MLTFKTGEYDAFEAEEKQLPSLASTETERRSSIPDWPVLRIGFALKSLPIAPGNTGSTAEVRLYFCDSENPLQSSFGWSNVMWHGLYVTAGNVHQIQQVIEATGKPENYEVILPYTHGVRDPEFPDSMGAIGWGWFGGHRGFMRPMLGIRVIPSIVLIAM